MAHEECPKRDHYWKPRPRCSGEICEKCLMHFPCDERDCGHLDCIEARAKTANPPICTVCRHKVDLVAGNLGLLDGNGKILFKCYTIEVRGKGKLICEPCFMKHKGPNENPED